MCIRDRPTTPQKWWRQILANVNEQVSSDLIKKMIAFFSNTVTLYTDTIEVDLNKSKRRNAFHDSGHTSFKENTVNLRI